MIVKEDVTHLTLLLKPHNLGEFTMISIITSSLSVPSSVFENQSVVNLILSYNFMLLMNRAINDFKVVLKTQSVWFFLALAGRPCFSKIMSG